MVTAVYNATSGVKRIAADDNDIKPFVVTASWAVAPTGDDATYLKGKYIRGASLVAGGNVKLRKNDLTSEDLDSTSAITVHVENDLSLTVSLANNPEAFRIATNNPNGGEYYTSEEKGTAESIYGQTAQSHTDNSAVYQYHTADSLEIAQVATLTIAAL